MLPVSKNSAVPFPTAASIVRGLDQLPSAPRIIPRLLKLLDDDNSSLYDIGEMIRLDAAMAAKVLRLANSIYFGKGARIVSIDEAITRIGYAQISEVVAYASASALIDRPMEAYQLSSDEMWSLSVSCAFAAEMLAFHSGEDANVAYALGLLHNVGMVVVNEYAHLSQPPVVMQNSGFPREWVDSERAFLGYSQEELGAELLHAWDFPAYMSTPVRFQYHPSGSVGNRRMAWLLHVAKWMRSRVCGQDIPVGLIQPQALAQLHLDGHQLMKMMAEVRLRLLGARHLLESQQSVA